MNEADKIIADIEAKKYAPVYFLMGEEPFYIDRITDYIAQNVLSEDEKGFDQMVLYGKDVTINDIIGNARRFPLIGSHQVLLVKEAQDLSKTIEDLENYFQAVQETTILVIAYKYKTIDKRKKLYKAVQKQGIVFESKKVREWDIDKWIKSFVASKKYSIDTKSAAMLSEFLGTDLGRIAKEIEKLQILLPEGSAITPDIIEKNIGISKEFNNFELIKAVSEKNAKAAYKIVHYFALNPKNNPLVVTFTLLYNYFSKVLQYHGMTYRDKNINPRTLAAQLKVTEYFLKDYQMGAKNYPMKTVSKNIEWIRIFDLKSKGVNAANMSHRDILNELLAKLFM